MTELTFTEPTKRTGRRVASAPGVFVFKLLVVCSQLPSLGCKQAPGPRRSAAVQYGEPVGIELGAQGSAPALAVALAVTKGRDATPGIGSLAIALHSAELACPAFETAVLAGKTARVEVAARNGALESLGSPPDEVGSACVAAALGGKPFKMDKPDALDLLLELRLGSPAATPRP